MAKHHMRFDEVKTETLNLRVSRRFKQTLKAVVEVKNSSMENTLEVILIDSCKQHPLPEDVKEEGSRLQTREKKANWGRS